MGKMISFQLLPQKRKKQFIENYRDELLSQKNSNIELPLEKGIQLELEIKATDELLLLFEKVKLDPSLQNQLSIRLSNFNILKGFSKHKVLKQDFTKSSMEKEVSTNLKNSISLDEKNTSFLKFFVPGLCLAN